MYHNTTVLVPDLKDYFGNKIPIHEEKEVAFWCLREVVVIIDEYNTKKTSFY